MKPPAQPHVPAIAPLALRPPLMAVSRNPLLEVADLDLQPVRTGVSLASLRPEAKGPVRCLVNGAPCYPITPRQWQHHLRLARAGRPDDARKYLGRAIRRAVVWERLRTQPGDIVVWHVVPQDKDLLKGVIAAVVAVVYGFYTQDWAGAFKLFVAIYAIENIFFPTSQSQQEQSQGGTVYSASLTGNQARLDKPIPRNCGLVKLTPPFAAMPYLEYIDSGKRDGAGRAIDSDQIYYAVLAVGIGRHDVIRAFIGKTPIANYQDVLVAQYLPPGTAPSRALCNVVTSTEVGGIELVSGEYSSAYVACQPTRKAQSIGIDISCPQGLGNLSGDLTVTWSVFWQEIDDFGRPLSSWAVLATETRTLNTNTAQRWSNRYFLPGVVSAFDGAFSFSVSAKRVSIVVARTDIKDTSTGARHALQWDGLRAYLNQPAPLNAHTGYYEVVMRASKQLGPQSQRDISMIVQAYARTWSAGGGWSCALHDWDNYTATRSPAWYLADLWVDPLWGEGRDEARVNLKGVADFAAICATRQDRFDFSFFDAVNAMDAAQMIAGTGRARVFERLGVATLARDALVTLPRTAFSPRNTVPGSMSVTEMTPKPPTLIDGIVLEYTSNVTWDIVTIECPCPGFTVTDEDDPRYDPALPKMTRPEYLRVEGIKGAKHAERTGLYEAAKRFYRRRITSCTTPMHGSVLAFMDAIRWQPEIAGIGQSGDVAFWDPTTLVMGLTEPLTFSDMGFTWLALQRDDGSLTTPVQVHPGPTSYDVILPAAPDFNLVLDDGTRERPKFFASFADVEVMRITEIDDGGKSAAKDGEAGVQLYNVDGFIDDARVHSADTHLLPGPGETQDPVDDGSGDYDSAVPGLPGGSGGGTLLLVGLTDHAVDSDAYPRTHALTEFVLTNDGHATSTASGRPSEDYAHEWMRFGTIEPAAAALYEVRFTWLGGPYLSGGGYPSSYCLGHPVVPTGGDALDTWLNLGTTRTLSLELYDTDLIDGEIAVAVYSRLRVEIREAASGVVQATRLLLLHCQTLDGPNTI